MLRLVSAGRGDSVGHLETGAAGGGQGRDVVGGPVARPVDTAALQLEIVDRKISVCGSKGLQHILSISFIEY